MLFNPKFDLFITVKHVKFNLLITVKHMKFNLFFTIKHMKFNILITVKHIKFNSLFTVKHKKFNLLITVKHMKFYLLFSVKHMKFNLLITVKHMKSYLLITVKHMKFNFLITVKHMKSSEWVKRRIFMTRAQGYRITILLKNHTLSQDFTILLFLRIFTHGERIEFQMNFRAHRQAESTIPPNLGLHRQFSRVKDKKKHEKIKEIRVKMAPSQNIQREMAKIGARYRLIFDFRR